MGHHYVNPDPFAKERRLDRPTCCAVSMVRSETCHCNPLNYSSLFYNIYFLFHPIANGVRVSSPLCAFTDDIRQQPCIGGRAPLRPHVCRPHARLDVGVAGGLAEGILTRTGPQFCGHSPRSMCPQPHRWGAQMRTLGTAAVSAGRPRARWWGRTIALLLYGPEETDGRVQEAIARMYGSQDRAIAVIDSIAPGTDLAIYSHVPHALNDVQDRLVLDVDSFVVLELARVVIKDEGFITRVINLSDCGLLEVPSTMGAATGARSIGGTNEVYGIHNDATVIDIVVASQALVAGPPGRCHISYAHKASNELLAIARSEGGKRFSPSFVRRAVTPPSGRSQVAHIVLALKRHVAGLRGFVFGGRPGLRGGLRRLIDLLAIATTVSNSMVLAMVSWIGFSDQYLVIHSRPRSKASGWVGGMHVTLRHRCLRRPPGASDELLVTTRPVRDKRFGPPWAALVGIDEPRVLMVVAAFTSLVTHREVAQAYL